MAQSTSLISESAITLPFRFTAAGNVQVETTQEAIWGDRVKAALGTIQGERLFYADFGTKIPATAWDTRSVMAEVIPEAVNDMFASLFPTLILDDVTASVEEATNTIYVDVVYRLPNQETVRTQTGIATLSGIYPLYEENR
jgi:hypothetical protein